MAVWQVQEAKTRLSDLIEEANNKGPQFITRHASERAVILSVRDYRALIAHKPDLREYLLSGPKVDRFDVPRSRDKDARSPCERSAAISAGYQHPIRDPQEAGE